MPDTSSNAPSAYLVPAGELWSTGWANIFSPLRLAAPSKFRADGLNYLRRHGWTGEPPAYLLPIPFVADGWILAADTGGGLVAVWSTHPIPWLEP